MKIKLCFIIIIILCSNCISIKELNKFKGDKSLKYGLWLEITENSDVKFIHFKKGTKHGTEKTLYSSGAYSICKYRNGKREGWFKMYSKEDKILYKDLYKNDSIRATEKYYEPKLFN